jgi:hypothetical protein
MILPMLSSFVFLVGFVIFVGFVIEGFFAPRSSGLDDSSLMGPPLYNKRAWKEPFQSEQPRSA